MRSYLFLGAAALVAASPAPQAFDVEVFDAIPVTIAQGPKPGATIESAYNQAQAQSTAAAAATGVATAQSAKRSVGAEVEARDLWWLWGNKETKVATTSTKAPATTAAPAANPSSTNMAPSSCTPVSWTNTFAFTADPACATDIEVGTYCGFINPDDPCAAQPNAYGPKTDPDTADAFKSNSVYHDLANSAKAPSGYVSSFVNQYGSVTGSGYLGYKELTSYDVNSCASYCDETSTCTGFNMFIERNPQWNPRQCSCTEPPSVTRFKCSIWGQDVNNGTATNYGQGQDGFEVVIAGSNGYNKGTYSPPTPPSCSQPQSCNKKLHNQPSYCMGQKTFPGPYDPSLCAAYAQNQNEVNRKHGIIGLILSLFGMNKGACVQFQAAYLEKAGAGFGTHCRLFTKKFSPSDANLDVSLGGKSKWGCQKSYTWSVDYRASFNWGGWSW
ncbi:hypothetical protein BDW02DRAFT_242372 [Decorospora gaudefroyi]|uniref:Apple domain-containing protein n=1 Tax=Decorospora gaudefroyi TaxID=184978 RepID=A0A6A5KGY1_9PLEO|nr:hypothetical protein BDW02DRAFT_242372 [Decorospora gaudefroyi]